MKLNPQIIQELLNDGKYTRTSISEKYNVSDAEARAYVVVVDNIGVIPNFKSGDKSDSDIKTYMVSGCWHVPFHNKVLYEGFKELVKVINPDGFVLAGDFIDVGSLSDYERGKISKTGITLEEEYDCANVVLDELDCILACNTLKYYLFGNHEERYFRWKADVNNSKYGDLLNPIKGMNLEERGYIVKSDYKNDYIELGSLQIFHGYYFNIHVAKQTLDKIRRNCMFPHTHRSQMYREGDFAAWNIGFMGDINAPCFSYAPRAMRESWSNGLAIVHVCKGKFYVEPIDVIDSHFIYGGKLY